MTATSCGGDAPATDGPIDAGTDEGMTCLLERGATDFTMGSGFLRNTSDDQVEVKGATLVGEENFELVGVWATPITGPLIGSWSQWPAPADVLSAATWSTRTPLEELTLGVRGNADANVNVIAHLRREDPDQPARTKGIRVEYRVGDKLYTAQTTVGLGLRSGDATTC